MNTRRSDQSPIPNPESLLGPQWFAVCTRWSRWKDRKKKVDWPLFPGYCFARFNVEDTLPILKCTGVVNIVSFEGKPAAIPEYELDSIRVLIDSELQFDPCPLIHEGMMVEVVHGPLKGVIG